MAPRTNERTLNARPHPGQALVHGDPAWLEQATSALEIVTAEEVQRVGQRYFARPLAIIRILPEP